MIAIMMVVVVVVVVVVMMQAPFVNICACQDGVLKVTVRLSAGASTYNWQTHTRATSTFALANSHRMSHWQSDRANDRAMVVSHGGVAYL